LDLFLRAVPPAKMVPALGLRRSMRVDAKYLQRNFSAQIFSIRSNAARKISGLSAQLRVCLEKRISASLFVIRPTAGLPW
jgi:hypothetical protein